MESKVSNAPARTDSHEPPAVDFSADDPEPCYRLTTLGHDRLVRARASLTWVGSAVHDPACRDMLAAFQMEIEATLHELDASRAIADRVSHARRGNEKTASFAARAPEQMEREHLQVTCRLLCSHHGDDCRRGATSQRHACRFEFDYAATRHTGLWKDIFMLRRLNEMEIKQ